MPWLFSVFHWESADGGSVSAWTWIALGVALGLAAGFLLGAGVASFNLRRQVSRKLQYLELLARRTSR